MSPRPADLDPDAQSGLAYAAVAHLSALEREQVLWWMTDHSPHALLVAIEGLRWEQQQVDGWDQAD